MRKSMTWQLGVIIICVIFASMIITSISNYWVTYKKTYEAAGIEAFGCANITTGLIAPSDIEMVMKGNKEKLKEIQQTLDWTTEHKQIFESQYMLLLDGTILAADSNLEKQGFKAGDQFYIDEEAIQKIKETKHPYYSEIYEYGGMKRLTGYAPIFKDHDPNKEIIAINAIDFDAKIVSERTWDSVKDSFILGLFPMLLASLITIWMIRRRTKPITAIINYAKKISAGDLSAENLKVKNRDEIGDLTSTLNLMAQNLRELIHHVSSSSDQVAASSEELNASAEQTILATKQITKIMNEMTVSVESQVQSVEETSLTIEEMSNSVHQIANNAQNVSSTAIVASEKAQEGGETIETAVQQMNSIHLTVNGLAEVVKGLGERSKEIGQITDVITEIAEQTNLLALNAAIEAARAGDQGRGFAVVADEVRKLAELSAQSAQEISQLIVMIQNETNHAIQSMGSATTEVVEGIGKVNKAGESLGIIQNSIEEVSIQIQEVSSAVQQMASGAERVVRSMEFVSKIEEEVAVQTKYVSGSTEEQLASIEEVSSSAGALANMAEELQMLIKKFKI
ncbi:methyl-accepting chemotaxis protein [Cytobacillus dafuensis]|uniref:Methyl-accepting chemotaxis protein n=1 Tax=Cytobacillus dafuensis TaxID=1742359 RepID=A0A5B8Z0V2_CYTDA|nr:methyl-accepting chemotaxis protein [Cytobacillus dafuensis]QED46538.1 methyl-accepting chemotaxis protein [Cytobacillus dafuensis]